MKNSITAIELKELLHDSNLVILDGTIPKVANSSTDEPAEKKYIIGARFFDIKKAFSDLKSDMPNTLPSTEQFEQECRKLGINSTSKIVVYDDLGIYSSPRVWWMFKAMGHSDIAVLDGGLPEWLKCGYATSTNPEQVLSLGDFEAKFNTSMLVDFDFIQANIEDKKALVIDARSSDRFHSLVPEPREDLKSGNISGSINIPYTDVLKDGKFKSRNELEKVFSVLQNEDRPLVFSCGSGITACVVSLASEYILENKKAIYDGSWTEYAQLN